jgi:sigma-E factor negative regulatory protein RseC
MHETGTIISTDGTKAVIQLDRGDKCEGCNVCHAFGENKMQLEATNTIGAKVGDWVNVVVEPKQVVKSSLLIFIFPLIMMLIGYAVAVKFIPPFSEGIGIIGAFTALALAFVFIKITDRRRNPDDMTSAIIVDLAQTFNRG